MKTYTDAEFKAAYPAQHAAMPTTVAELRAQIAESKAAIVLRYQAIIVDPNETAVQRDMACTLLARITR